MIINGTILKEYIQDNIPLASEELRCISEYYLQHKRIVGNINLEDFEEYLQSICGVFRYYEWYMETERELHSDEEANLLNSYDLKKSIFYYKYSKHKFNGNKPWKELEDKIESNLKTKFEDYSYYSGLRVLQFYLRVIYTLNHEPNEYLEDYFFIRIPHVHDDFSYAVEFYNACDRRSIRFVGDNRRWRKFENVVLDSWEKEINEENNIHFLNGLKEGFIEYLRMCKCRLDDLEERISPNCRKNILNLLLI
jgi:hypothetical protein